MQVKEKGAIDVFGSIFSKMDLVEPIYSIVKVNCDKNAQIIAKQLLPLTRRYRGNLCDTNGPQLLRV
jgi:hypothetical protein